MIYSQAQRKLEQYAQNPYIKNEDYWLYIITPKIHKDKKIFLDDLKNKKCNINDAKKYSTDDQFEVDTLMMKSFNLS